MEELINEQRDKIRVMIKVIEESDVVEYGVLNHLTKQANVLNALESTMVI